MRYLFLTITLSLLCLPLSVKAQSMRTEIKAKPLVQFSFACTKETLYPNKKLDRLVRPLIEKADTPIVYGDRAFKFDLNGDKVDEFFVPIECGVIDFCWWGIFSVNPARVLGFVGGSTIYIHKRVGLWSQLTVVTDEGVSDGRISKYHFRNGHYRKFGGDFDTSAYRDDFPKSLLTVHPTCDPSYRPERAQN